MMDRCRFHGSGSTRNVRTPGNSSKGLGQVYGNRLLANVCCTEK
jgi:hypothetical protein